jgi:transcription-repair coupling factor (superfamily II helicase)
MRSRWPTSHVARPAQKRMVAVVSAEPRAAQRLAEEVPWFAPDVRVALLPDWETLPYDQFSPHQDLVSERLATLYHVSRGECDLLIVSATSALYRLAPPSYLAAFTFFLRQAETLDVDALRAQLSLAGYSNVTQVVSPGEFSVRGGLIDLFPMGSALPYRIDLFDNEIESIKTFDVDTQRTLYPVRDVRLLPAREFPLDEAGRTRFRSRFREVFEGDPSKSALYKDVSNGIVPGGIEYYLPLFFDATATLADYVPPTAVIAVARRRARRSRAVLAGHRIALPPAARRQGASAPSADELLRRARRIQRGDQAVRARRDRKRRRRADARALQRCRWTGARTTRSPR